MANEQPITIIGRLTADPELRFIPSGQAVCSFQVASNPRKYDKQTDKWVDQAATFWRCTAWRDMGENVAESLRKGVAVIVQGNITSREWEDKDGGKRTSLEVDVQAVGPDLRWASATVVKAQRAGAPGVRAPEVDPWAAPAKPAEDEPPF